MSMEQGLEPERVRTMLLYVGTPAEAWLTETVYALSGYGPRTFAWWREQFIDLGVADDHEVAITSEQEYDVIVPKFTITRPATDEEVAAVLAGEADQERRRLARMAEELADAGFTVEPPPS